MKKIEAIVRPEKYEQVKDALNEIEVKGITVHQVMGCGHQRGRVENVRGLDVDLELNRKIKFEIVVSTDEWAEKTIAAIQEAAYTGEVGDGKIFVHDLEDVIKIRTGERGVKAI